MKDAEITIDQELDSIMEAFEGDKNPMRVYDLLNSQLSVIHARAASLLGLASVVITVTGFSGRIIADTNDYAQALIIMGIAGVGTGAAITITRVIPIRWITKDLHLPTREWLRTTMERRDRKNKAFLVSTWFMACGMIFYLTAISVMLMYPEAGELTMVK